ncbi:GD22042 [Drosophila simulans]|uniref:GD22042 n=1 Tax=Drosophila simulans TaxID=7240 RepID=B4Q563_DROSI|nr:GD22042 [Drosophila simulans]
MSAYRLSCIGNAEWGPRTSNRSRSLFNSEAVERDKWTQFFFNLPKGASRIAAGQSPSGSGARAGQEQAEGCFGTNRILTKK